jgi:single-stranded DNA-binding protein
VWGKYGQKVFDKFQNGKGRLVQMSGRIRTWESVDNNTQSKRYGWEVVADHITAVERDNKTCLDFCKQYIPGFTPEMLENYKGSLYGVFEGNEQGESFADAPAAPEPKKPVEQQQPKQQSPVDDTDFDPFADS